MKVAMRRVLKASLFSLVGMINVQASPSSEVITISIEGNVGAGKSVLTTLLAEAFQAKKVDEPVAEWCTLRGGSLVENYFADRKRWAFTFLTYATLTALRAPLEYLNQRTEGQNLIFTDRSPFSGFYCVRTLMELDGVNELTPMESQIYQELTQFLLEKTNEYKLDGIIYVRTSPEIALQRDRTRTRAEHFTDNMSLVQAMHAVHEVWLRGRFCFDSYLKDVSVLEVDGDKDFEHDATAFKVIAEEVKVFVDTIKANRSAKNNVPAAA